MRERKRDARGLEVVIPGRRKPLQLDHVVLDFNGTMAVDGRLISGVNPRLRRLAESVDIVVMTADTFGTARRALTDLPVTVRIVRSGADKRRLVESLGPGKVAAVGNGANDVSMLRTAALSVAVLDDEGAAGEALRAATVVVRSINDALDLLLKTQRLVATLRR